MTGEKSDPILRLLLSKTSFYNPCHCETVQRKAKHFTPILLKESKLGETYKVISHTEWE